ncbi:autoinducer binding domain-containing protein [Yoonia litorea]
MATAKTVEALWALHTEKMATYGFDRLIYGFTRNGTSSTFGKPQDQLILSTQTPEYMRRFVQEGLYYNAPMLRWALENQGACSWRWMMDMERVDNLTAAEKKVLAFNKSMGVTAGYTISFLSLAQRIKGAIALTAKAGLSQDEVDAIWGTHGEEILLMNNIMHLKVLTLPYAGERRLTKRQREVLQWVGDGKTTQDIAILLGLTPATVEKHLRLAREALDVDTTAQAILKAALHNQMYVVDADN